MFSLHGKVAVVTGVSSGMGLEASILFLELGARVFGVDINEPPANLTSQEKAFHFGQFDLLDQTAPESIICASIERFGRVDILLNIAGARDNFAGLEAIDPDTWNRVMTVNVTVPALLAKYAIIHFKKFGGGAIINVSSKAGTSGAIAGAAYTASKHAIIGLTKSVAWRYRNDRITCNAICPGGFSTGGTKTLDASKFDMATMEHLRPVHLLHAHPGEDAAHPRQAAYLLAFLASSEASHINGAIVPIDNAWSTI